MSKSHSSVQITITGHKFDDSEYMIGRVRPMFEELFQTSLKVLLVKDENTMILYAYSKRVALILHKWGMPFGRKKLYHLTPALALDEVSFIRGHSTRTVAYIENMAPTFKFSSSSLPYPYSRILERLYQNWGFILHRLRAMIRSSDSSSADKLR